MRPSSDETDNCPAKFPDRLVCMIMAKKDKLSSYSLLNVGGDGTKLNSPLVRVSWESTSVVRAGSILDTSPLAALSSMALHRRFSVM